jgi:anaerobic magnesium-protoporphyrin IX monomethyl ester cyclase
MKITFINPSVWHLQSIHYRLNRPLGGPILCTILEKAGHQANFIDAEALQWNDIQVKRYIDKESPDVVATTALWHNREAVKELAVLAKGKRLIVGGPFAKTNYEDLASFGYNAICISEGEDLIAEMVVDNNWKPEGIDLHAANTQSFDDIPIINYDLCFPADDWYIGNEPRLELPEVVSLWTRGCPHHCLFCSNPIFNKGKVRVMSPDRVYEEMNILKHRGIKTVFVYSDELIGLGPKYDKWLEEVCERIAPLQLLYKTQGRCSVKQQASTFEAMYNAGFRVIMWGIESLSQKVLDALHKGTTPDDIFHSLSLAHQAGIKNYGFFMVGGIDETETDFMLTEANTKTLREAGLLDHGQVSVMTAEPGSELWGLASKEGWLPQAPPARSHFEPYLNVPWASHVELLRRQRLLSEVITS